MPLFRQPIFSRPSSLSFYYVILPPNGHLYSTTLGFLLHFLNSGPGDGINSLGMSLFLLEETLLLSSWVASVVSSALSASPAFYTLWVCGAWAEEANSSK